MNWPQNIITIAKAIAKAEGSNPDWNNPGDLTGLDGRGYEVTGVANRDGVLIFAHAEDGQDALCKKIARILAGQSEVYPIHMTLEQGGLVYANGDPHWAVNVASELNVPLSITFGELAQLTLPCAPSNTSA